LGHPPFPPRKRGGREVRKFEGKKVRKQERNSQRIKRIKQIKQMTPPCCPPASFFGGERREKGRKGEGVKGRIHTGVREGRG
jgi:hypothetical protein